MGMSPIAEQIRSALPPDCQAINKAGEVMVIIEEPGKIPMIANLSRLSESKLMELALKLGILVE